MAITHPTTVRNSLADLVVDLLDAGAGPGKVRVFAGGTGGTLLCQITLADPAFGAAASAVATAAGLPKEGTATVAGTANAFTVVDSVDVIAFQGTITATAGGGDMELTSTTIAINDVIRINTFTYTAPP